VFDRLARQETVTIAIEGRVFAAADDMADPGRDARTEAFLRERRRLLLLAYRMVGSLTEAEDVVQESWLRWQAAGESDTAIRNEAAWLTKVVTRLCVDHLRSPRLRRERCVAPWLPEPIAGADSELGPLEVAEQRSTLSLAMLALLERLTPRERAAVVLAEAFGYSHAEVAEVLGVGYAASRQIHSRAMRRLADSRRRRRPVSRRQHVELLERFLDAAGSGDLGELTTVLVNDVVLTGDGGERRRATGAGRRPGRPLPARRARPAPGGRTGGGPADQRAAADRHGRWRG
jgi:RNA polymerase sigma-70 factor (ECF subfamily)